MSEGKNAYEIRLDLLLMAERMVSDNKMHDWQSNMESGSPASNFKAPTYTTEEVISTANMLSEFVAQKKPYIPS